MAITAERSTTRARRALGLLAGQRPDDGQICLACGAPVNADDAIWHHGDAFHSDCAGYRRRTAA